MQMNDIYILPILIILAICIIYIFLKVNNISKAEYNMTFYRLLMKDFRKEAERLRMNLEQFNNNFERQKEGSKIEPFDNAKNEELKKIMAEEERVNHPNHYSHGIEPIEYIESHNLNFNLGNVIKYVSRAPYKGREIEDLKKAKWYLEREIERKEHK